MGGWKSHRYLDVRESKNLSPQSYLCHFINHLLSVIGNLSGEGELLYWALLDGSSGVAKLCQ